MFERFLLGETLEECYDAVAEVANRWLDMLDTQVPARCLEIFKLDRMMLPAVLCCAVLCCAVLCCSVPKRDKWHLLMTSVA